VDAFHRELGDSGLPVLFDVREWLGQRSIPEAESADLLTLRKLLFFFLQEDRWCGGGLASRCADGSIERILCRLRYLLEHDLA
jgi:hypothetical protein